MEDPRLVADIPHEHPWCSYGKDTHSISPIPCRRVTRYRLELAESRFGGARIIAQQFPDEEAAGAVIVHWQHGFLGMIRYQLWADVEYRPVAGASLLIFHVEFSPNPIPLGSKMACRVGLLNCGTVHIGNSLEQPRGGQFILGIPAIQGPDGVVRNLSDFLRPRQYQKEIDVNLAPGEQMFIDWSAEEAIPDNAISQAYADAGMYTTWVVLQDRILAYDRDLSTRSEPVQIQFV